MINDVNKAAKEVKNLIGDSHHAKVGHPGRPEKEQRCEHITVYMACLGYIHKEKTRKVLQPDATLEEARKQFGRNMRQQRILDEGYHQVTSSEPLWKFSNNCKVSLLFAYDKQEELKLAGRNTWKVATLSARMTSNLVGSLVSSPKQNGNDHKMKIQKSSDVAENDSAAPTTEQ